MKINYGYLLVQTIYSQFNQFSNSGQRGSASFNELLKCCREFSFQYNELWYCEACVSSKAYTVFLARKRSNFLHDTSRTIVLTESTNIMSVAIQIRLLWYSSGLSGHKRHPSQVQHPLRITSCACSRGQPSLNEHPLRNQAYVRVRRCNFFSSII